MIPDPEDFIFSAPTSVTYALQMFKDDRWIGCCVHTDKEWLENQRKKFLTIAPERSYRIVKFETFGTVIS